MASRGVNHGLAGAEALTVDRGTRPMRQLMHGRHGSRARRGYRHGRPIRFAVRGAGISAGVPTPCTPSHRLHELQQKQKDGPKWPAPTPFPVAGPARGGSCGERRGLERPVSASQDRGDGATGRPASAATASGSRCDRSRESHPSPVDPLQDRGRFRSTATTAVKPQWHAPWSPGADV